MIHVIAKITAQPGKRTEILQAFHANIPAVLAEKGCIEYQPVTDAADALNWQTKMGEDAFLVIEKWETMDDLDAHAKSPHMAAYSKKVTALVADRQVHILEDSA